MEEPRFADARGSEIGEAVALVHPNPERQRSGVPLAALCQWKNPASLTLGVRIK